MWRHIGYVPMEEKLVCKCLPTAWSNKKTLSAVWFGKLNWRLNLQVIPSDKRWGMFLRSCEKQTLPPGWSLYSKAWTWLLKTWLYFKGSQSLTYWQVLACLGHLLKRQPEIWAVLIIPHLKQQDCLVNYKSLGSL